jgi:pimeloyl-ACP methyl ester carboxylesterase
MNEGILTRADGHALHFYDQGPHAGELAVFWLHGTPNIGVPPAPLFADAARLGLRWIGYDRPGYGGSTRRAGRTVASAAADVASIADHLGLDTFAVMGHSGGGPHALACAALLPHRVLAAVSAAGLAPFDAADLDWFAGMHPSGAASLRAAHAGLAAKTAYEAASAAFDPTLFTAADQAALSGPWAWLETVVAPALAQGPGGLIDDDIAYVSPWGVDCSRIAPPVLLLHGDDDRIVPAAHSAWLARHCPAATLWQRPGEGHLSVLNMAGRALDWLRARHPAAPPDRPGR